MVFQLDDSIRDDYLVEAREIVEQLGGELVQLEKRPDDRELLNAIFRGFHTIKGGAGFLSVAPLVDLCHCAEEMFDRLRRGDGTMSADLMDAALQALDLVSAMLEAMAEGNDPKPPPKSLLARLEHEAVEEAATGQIDSLRGEVRDAADLEFEEMLRESRENEGPGSEQESGSDEITDDEFEALLDQMQETGAIAQTVDSGEGEPVDPSPIQSAAGEVQDLCGIGAVEAPSAVMSGSPAASATETTIRVPVTSLDSVMNLVGELVLVRNRLTNLGGRLKDEELQKAVENLDLVTADLQTGVMQTRMQPIGKVFSRFPRLARDVARNLNKEIELELHGEETDLDKNLVEALADPLIHLVRNAMDHGIELPDVRLAKGKSRAGTVRLAAEQEGDHIVITVSDDGAGIDPDKLRDKAVAKGLITADAASKLGESECLDLIFMAGFSTRDEVSDISGRGVGMDVVKTRIAKLNGTVEIASKPDEGTSVRVRVPLTLAILPTLMVEIGKRAFAFPLAHVLEVFFLEPEKVHTVAGREVIMVRGKPLPLINLPTRLLGEAQAGEGGGVYVVVVRVGNSTVGFMTSDVLGQEEVVIKPLGGMLQGLSEFAGATITGDGYIALIFDVNGLLKRLSNAA